MEKTEVEQYLDQKKISYETLDFKKADSFDFQEMLKNRQIDPVLVCKTLVLKGDKTGVIIAVVPLFAHLDYQKARKVSGDRKIGFPSMDFVMAHTGYPHGANTPIGIYRGHPEYLFLVDDSFKEKDELVMASGELGRSIKIARKDFEKIVPFTYAELIN